MKSKLLPLLTYLFIMSNIANAQINSGNNSVLWKIQYPNSSHTSYLLGTYHVFGNDWLKSFPVLDSLLRTSTIFISENTKTAAQTLAIMPDENRTPQELFGKDFDKVNKYMVDGSGGGLVEMMDAKTTKVPEVSALLGLTYYLLGDITERAKLKVNPGETYMDVSLTLKADSLKKESLGLDDGSPNLTSALASKDLVPELTSKIVQYVNILTQPKQTGVNMPKSKEEIENINFMKALKLYNKGQYKYDFGPCPDNMKFLLDARNKNWMQQLPPLIKTKNCFIDVGIGHLDYQNGLITQLLKQGFVVTPVAL